MSLFSGLARALRPMAESSLESQALIERRVRTRADGGKITESWQTVLSAVPCRLSALAMPQGEVLTADQISALNRFQVSFPMATPVSEGMRVTVSGTDLDGHAWTRANLHVIATDAPTTYEVLRNATVEVPLEEVT